jgi:methyl-accepting chemotaxis protein
MNFRNLKVSHRSAIGFGLIGLIVILLGIYSIKQMAEIRSRSVEADTVWLPSIILLGDMADNVMRTRVFSLRLVLLNDPVVDEATRASLITFRQDLEKFESKYRQDIEGQ